uniref:ABC-type amino acid transport/signal transduction systems periplasmic component/domain-like protein n=1 Tax=Shewanella sp. (strain MR-7) TaxID=60481 RepID=Q0HQF7_SHESR
MMRLLYPLIALLCVILLSPAAHGTDELSPFRLRFCVEDTEYPPFNYFIRQDGIKTSTLSGYDIDLLERTFKPIGIDYEVQALPWLRCLKDVQNGSIDAAMSASLNRQRATDYIPSVAYYYLTPSYFYLKAELDTQFHINDINQLADFGTVCGIKGFNYDNFGWRKETPINEINSLHHLPEMLLKHRCKFFIARKEILAGTLALTQAGELPKALTSQVSPNSEREPFYMLISKRSDHKDLIASEFNRQVKLMQDSHQLETLYQFHIQKLTHGDDKGSDSL